MGLIRHGYINIEDPLRNQQKKFAYSYPTNYTIGMKNAWSSTKDVFSPHQNKLETVGEALDFYNSYTKKLKKMSLNEIEEIAEDPTHKDYHAMMHRYTLAHMLTKALTDKEYDELKDSPCYQTVLTLFEELDEINNPKDRDNHLAGRMLDNTLNRSEEIWLSCRSYDELKDALLEASKAGDETISNIFKRYGNQFLNHRDFLYTEAFLTAIKHNQTARATMFSEVDILHVDASGNSPLDYAIVSEDKKLISRILTRITHTRNDAYIEHDTAMKKGKNIIEHAIQTAKELSSTSTSTESGNNSKDIIDLLEKELNEFYNFKKKKDTKLPQHSDQPVWDLN